MIENAVTDLPLPDSPTRPSVSPGAIAKLTSIDRRHEAAVDVEAGRQVLDAEQRRRQTSISVMLAEHRAQRVRDLADRRVALRPPG